MGNQLRILHVVVNMNRGGAETLIMNLFRNVDRTKIQFDFLTCKEGVFDEEIIKLGGKIHRIPYVTDVGHYKYIKELDKFFEHNYYSCVHSHLDKMSGIVLHSAQKAGIPIRIAHSHNTRSEGSFPARLYKYYSGKFISDCATHYLACSFQAAKWLFPDQAGTALVIRNGVDVDKFKHSAKNRKEIREKLKIAPETFVVGHVGRFSEQKNHKFLIEIFDEVVKIEPNSVLVLAGEGPLRKEMEIRLAKKGLTNKARFVGVRSDINILLQSFDVFLFPSIFEGLPVSLIEAQAAGIACVISDVISEEVDVGAGLIHFENLKNSSYIWAKKIMELKNIKKDIKDFIKTKGYDIQTSAKNLQNFYLGLHSNKNGSKTLYI